MATSPIPLNPPEAGLSGQGTAGAAAVPSAPGTNLPAVLTQEAADQRYAPKTVTDSVTHHTYNTAPAIANGVPTLEQVD